MRKLFGFILLSGAFVLTSAKGATQSNLTFRVMTWNIHHGEGEDGREDLQRIANLIRVEAADVVALQEVDKGVERTQRRDLPAELAKLAKMSVVFSNNYTFQGGEYGNAVLTRFPILSATNLHYPKVHETEQRGLLQIVVDVHGQRVNVFDTHLDYRPADAARWSNVQVIEKLVEASKDVPVILCGDFNTAPHGRVYERLSQTFDDSWKLAGRGDGFTIPATKPNRRIDFIWITKKSGIKPERSWVPESLASDHRPVMAEFQVKVTP